MPIWQIKKLSLREINWVGQNHTTTKGKNQRQNPTGTLPSKSILFQLTTLPNPLWGGWEDFLIWLPGRRQWVWKQKTIKTCLRNNEPTRFQDKREAPQVSGEHQRLPVNQIWLTLLRVGRSTENWSWKKKKIWFWILTLLLTILCNFKQVIPTSLDFITVFASAKVDYWICKCEVLCKKNHQF